MKLSIIFALALAACGPVEALPSAPPSVAETTPCAPVDAGTDAPVLPDAEPAMVAKDAAVLAYCAAACQTLWTCETPRDVDGGACLAACTAGTTAMREPLYSELGTCLTSFTLLHCQYATPHAECSFLTAWEGAP